MDFALRAALWVALASCAGCVPRATWSASGMEPAAMYDASRVACAGLSAPDADPLASVPWTRVRAIRVIEGKARVHRTAGVRLIAEDARAPDLERRVRCRVYRLGSFQDDPRARELLAIPDLEVRVTRRGETLEVHLTTRTRSHGVELVQRARALAN